MKRMLRIGRQGSSAGKPPGSGRPVELPAESKLGLLHAAEIFRDLNDDEMLAVEKMAVMSTCERGKVIYAPDQTGQALFLLKRGKVHIYRITAEGRKLITAVIGPGTMFGDMAFTGQAMLDSFAEAVEDSILCVLSRHDIEELVRRYPPVGIRLMDSLAHRVQELERRLEEASLHDMPSRVAAALLRIRDRERSDRLSVTHQELADSVGTYRETVTRVLDDLRDRGLVQLERRCISIVDVAGLRTLIASEGEAAKG